MFLCLSCGSGFTVCILKGGMSVWLGNIEGEVAGGWDGRAQMRSTWTAERKDIWREVDTNIE